MRVATITDFKPFIYQGLLSLSRVANECGLNRDVFYTSPDIRDIHWPVIIKRLEDARPLMVGYVWKSLIPNQCPGTRRADEGRM